MDGKLSQDCIRYKLFFQFITRRLETTLYNPVRPVISVGFCHFPPALDRPIAITQTL